MLFLPARGAHQINVSFKRHIAAIDGEHGAGHNRGFVAREVQNQRHDLFGSCDGQEVERIHNLLRARFFDPLELGSVVTKLRQTALTRTPSLAIPAAKERVTEITPPLAAV